VSILIAAGTGVWYTSWCAGCSTPASTSRGAPGVRGALDARRRPPLEGISISVKNERHRRMAGDDELNAHKRQPGDIRAVDKLLAAGAVLHAQTKRHRSSVSFRWTWSPAFGRHPESLESADHLGKLAASILARRPISRAIDPATKDCNARAQPAA
jgi:hypothetical protein